MPRIDAGKPSKPKPKYKLPKAAPRGDAPQTRKQDFAKADAHKKTSSYKHAIRTSYRQKDQAGRDARVRVIADKLNAKVDPRDRVLRHDFLPGDHYGKGSTGTGYGRTALARYMDAVRDAARLNTEDKAVLKTYLHRQARDRLLMNSRENTRQERIIERHKNSPDFKGALKAAARPKGPKPRSAPVSQLGGSTLGPLRPFVGTAESVEAVAEATYHDPVSVPLKTAKQALLAVPAAIGAIPETIMHPIKMTEESYKEFLKRSSQSQAEKVKVIRKEGGFVYLADAAAVFGTGSGVGRILVRPKPRAGLRLSGGTVKKRVTHSGLAGQIARTKLDAARARKLEKKLQAAEAGGKPISALDRQAAMANRRAGATVEVTPRLGLRATRAQKREGVAKPRGRAVYGLKSDQGRRLGLDQKIMNTLDKHEKKALYYAAALGIRTADQARALLPGLVAKIEAHRKANGIVVTGRLKEADMLPEIAAIIKAPEAHFTQKLADAIDTMTPDSLRAGLEDPRFTAETAARRRHAPQSVLLDVERGVSDAPAPALRYFDETDLEHVKRVAAKADSLGLGTPLYFKSERYPGVRDFAAHAVGIKGMGKDQRYTGENLLAGLQDTSAAGYLRGKARNIKAKHNWNLNLEILDKNALREFARPGGEKLSVLLARLAEAGVDQGSVGFVDRNIFERAMRDPGPEGRDFADSEEFEMAAINKALGDSIVTRADLTQTKLDHSTKWEVVPIAVLREMEAQTTPSGVLGRSADIVKGKMSRAILLTGNVPWQTFQLVSDSMMAAAATGGRALNPANWLGAARWWNRDLTPEDRQAVGGMLGLDSTGADSHQIKLGASTNSDLVNTYRAIKAHPFWHTGVAAGHGPSISELNPLEIMALVDRKRSNATRILAGFTKQKREAVHRMGEEMGRVDRAQLKITSILAKPPAEQMRMLSRDREVLEEHADAVADWMGDWTTLTAAERKIGNRWVMFYPYMRYSLRLLFYTLPVKHPTVTAVLAELGQLRVDELREIFGNDDGALFWNLGKVYFGKDGNVKSIDLKRAHPALNALWDAAGAMATQDRGPGQLVGMLPPWVGWAADQLADESLFTGKDWRIQGRAAGYGQKIPLLAPERARILLDDALSLTFAYRTGETLTQSGAQGDDSLLDLPILPGLFSSRPTHFKGNTTPSKLKAKFGKRGEAFEAEHESIWHELFPVLPEANRDAARAREQRIIAKAEQPAKKRKKNKGYFGGSSGGGYKFGGGR